LASRNTAALRSSSPHAADEPWTTAVLSHSQSSPPMPAPSRSDSGRLKDPQQRSARRVRPAGRDLPRPPQRMLSGPTRRLSLGCGAGASSPSKPPPSYSGTPLDAVIVIETMRGPSPSTVRRPSPQTARRAVSPSPDPAKSAELLRTGADSARALSAPPNGYMTPLLTPALSHLPAALSAAYLSSLHAGGTASPQCLAPSSRVSPGRCSPGRCRSPSPALPQPPPFPMGMVFAPASNESLPSGGSLSTAGPVAVQRFSSSPPGDGVSVSTGASMSYVPSFTACGSSIAVPAVGTPRLIQATPVTAALFSPRMRYNELEPRGLVSPKGPRSSIGGAELGSASAAARRVSSPMPASPGSSTMVPMLGGRRAYPSARLSLPQPGRVPAMPTAWSGSNEQRQLSAGSPRQSPAPMRRTSGPTAAA